MTDENANPAPDNTGATAETQVALPPDQQALILKEPANPFDEAVTGIAASQPRLFGGEVGANLLRAIIRQQNREVATANVEIRTLRSEKDVLRETVSDLRVEVAGFKQREGAGKDIQRLKNLAILIGTLLVKFSYDFAKDKVHAAAVFCGIAGAILIGFGWFADVKAVK